MTALTEFEAGAPESFSAITAAVPTVPKGSMSSAGEDEPSPIGGAGRTRFTAILATAGIVTGALVMMGVVWVLTSSKSGPPGEASPTTVASTTVGGMVVPAADQAPSPAPTPTAQTDPALASELPTPPSVKAPRTRTRGIPVPSAKKPCGKLSKPCR
jgi:hypothetical protein